MELFHVRVVLSIFILLGLVIISIITILKPEPGKVGRSFLGLVLALFAWYLLHNISFFLSRWGSPSYTVGSLAGVAVISVGTSLYIFCEYFPEGTHDKRSYKRILAALAIGICLAPLTFSKLWISNRGVGGAIIGPFFYVTSGWVVVAILSGLFLQIRKLKKTKDPRKRNRIRRLLTAVLINLSITVFFSVILPVLGSWKLFFFGPASAIIGLTLIIYAIQFHPMLNLRAVIFQTGLRITIGVFICSLIYILLTYLASYNESTRFSWSLAFVFLIFFFSGVLYSVVLHPKLEKRIFPRRLLADEVIVNVFLRQAAGAHPSLSVVLHEILEPIVQELDLKRALAIVVDHEDKMILYEIGENPQELKTIASRLIFSRLGRDRRFSHELIEEGDRIFLLDEDASIPFKKKTTFTRKYGRLVQRTLGFRSRVVKLGCRIVLPLVFRNEICGYLLLGDKNSGRPYFEKEIELLEKLRTPFAALLRNHIYYERIQSLMIRAEAELRDLKQVKSQLVVKEQKAGGRVLVYRSTLMEDVMEHVKRIAPLSRPIFINGETGTGKELIAMLSHELGRPQEKFVSINCAALPPTLWEDEIFGHVKGAFTDAKTNRQGAVARAGQGTLFFDEIGEMPLAMQAKLLRLLQERQFMPLGGTENLPADCRFIFATNRNLEESIRKGEFREDLYYRINVFRLDLAPLRERSEDIEPLVNHLIKSFSTEMNSSVEFVDPQAMRILVGHTWPGNVRELENALLRALSNAPGPSLRVDDIQEIAKEANSRPKVPRIVTLLPEVTTDEGSFHDIMEACARRVIVSAMDRTQGNKTRAAKLLGIRRSSLDYRLKELKIGE